MTKPISGYQPFPKLDSPIVDPNGQLAFPWYQLFVRMWDSIGLSHTQILDTAVLKSSAGSSPINIVDRTGAALSALSLKSGGTGSDLSSTGVGVLKQTLQGAPVTVEALSSADLTDGVTGSGAIVLATKASLTGPTLTGPTLSGATLSGDTTLQGPITASASAGASNLGDQIFNNCKISASALNVTSSTVLVLVPGLSVNLSAGASYRIRGWLHGSSTVNGGIKVAIVGSGGLTATASIFQAILRNGTSLLSNLSVTSLGSLIANSLVVYTDIMIEGSITVGRAGSIQLQAAQNTSSIDTTSISRGSTFEALRTS